MDKNTCWTMSSLDVRHQNSMYYLCIGFFQLLIWPCARMDFFPTKEPTFYYNWDMYFFKSHVHCQMLCAPTSYPLINKHIDVHSRTSCSTSNSEQGDEKSTLKMLCGKLGSMISKHRSKKPHVVD